MPNEWFDVFGALGFINLCINPLIYAARYEVFRPSLKMMLSKNDALESRGATSTWAA